MKTIIFSVKNSYFFSCLLENSVWSGNAKEYNFWIFTQFFFFGTFLQCFMSWRQSSIKRNVCMGIPQHLFCRSAWRSYRNQWLQSIHQKAIPILLTLAYVIFSVLLYDSYPIPQQRNFFPLLPSVKEISK